MALVTLQTGYLENNSRGSGRHRFEVHAIS
jgi:hypothetical protein